MYHLIIKTLLLDILVRKIKDDRKVQRPFEHHTALTDAIFS